MIRHLARHVDWWSVGLLEVVLLTIAYHAETWLMAGLVLAFPVLAALRGHLMYCTIPRSLGVDD